MNLVKHVEIVRSISFVSAILAGMNLQVSQLSVIQ